MNTRRTSATDTGIAIASYEEAARRFACAPRSPFPLFVTEGVLRDIARTIGTAPPETGGMLLRPILSLGIDTFVPDAVGSARATRSTYSPDTETMTRALEEYLDGDPEEARLWAGWVHSHPSNFGAPSQQVGTGLGDIGYAKECLAASPGIEIFALPIVTGTDDRRRTPTLWPWVILRSAPDTPRYADVIIIEEIEHLPEYPFPLTSTRSEAHPAAVCLDLDEIAERTRTAVTVRGGCWRFTTAESDAYVELALPSGWRPAEQAPLLRLGLGNADPVELPIAWKENDRMRRVEVRLANAVSRALAFAKEV